MRVNIRRENVWAEVLAAVTARHAAGDTRAAGAGRARTGLDCAKADRYLSSGACLNGVSVMSISPSRYEVVNVSQLERFEDGSVVGLQQFSDVGLIDRGTSKVKILGGGALTKRLQVTAHKFSKAAEQKITGCGGTVQVA